MHVESQIPVIVRFGVFEADFRAGELRRSGRRVRIQDLPFRALQVLLERPNEVVSREELRTALWPPDVFVDFDRGISSTIKRLRDALGDSADNPIFIETLERRGYRWIAPIMVLGATSAAKEAESSSPEPAAQLDAPSTVFSQDTAIPTGNGFPVRLALGLLVFSIAVLITVWAVWGVASAKLHPAHPANQQA
jgi:DNA-binding winged helix-turn-helix (wHTH) protein